MKNFYFTVFILFITHFCVSQVNVEISDFKTNNLASNSINFNNQNVVNISFKVKLKTFNGEPNNILGNLYVNTKDSQGTLYPVQRYFQAVTFIVQYPPFVTQTTYSASFDVSLQLIASEYYSSGGALYCEYVNNNGTSFSSANKEIIGGSKVVPTNPGSQTNVICCNQTIRYGDKPSLITGSILTGQTVANWYTQTGLYSYNQASDARNSLDADYMYSSMIFTRVIGSTYPYKRSNEITITVVPTPILSANISTNGIVRPDGKYEISNQQNIEFYGDNSKVNLNILENPFHTPSRGDSFAEVVDYQWQYKNFTHLSRWSDIPNATSSNLSSFIPQYPTQNYKVRRVSKYQGISRVSNEIEILIRNTSNQNVICCDQVLSFSASGTQSPEVITGSVFVFNINDFINPSEVSSLNTSSFIYQWQKQTRSLSWENITVNGNSKDYLPLIENNSSGRGQSTKYRRVIKGDYSYYPNIVNTLQYRLFELYSNEVLISTSGGVRGREGVNSNINAFKETIQKEEVVAYPNPVSSILSIESPIDISSSKITFMNEIGKEITVKEISVIDTGLVTVNMNELPKGIYILKIQTDAAIIYRKIIKN